MKLSSWLYDLTFYAIEIDFMENEDFNFTNDTKKSHGVGNLMIDDAKSKSVFYDDRCFMFS